MRIDIFQESIKEKKVRLDTVSRSRAELESTKLRLENQLTTNLHRKRESLQSVATLVLECLISLYKFLSF